MLVKYQSKQAHIASSTNGYINSHTTSIAVSADITRSGSSANINTNQNDPYQDLVIITGVGKSRNDGEASVIKPLIQVQTCNL